MPNHTILLIPSGGPFKIKIFWRNKISLIVLIIMESYIVLFLNKALLIILISCSQDVLHTILNPDIEDPGMARLPIIVYNVIKTHVNHHVGQVVHTSCSHDRISVHLHRAIEYGLLLR